MAKSLGPTYADRIRFVVRMGDKRYLQLDFEGEAVRIDDATKASAFETYEEAQKAAWAFQAEPYEVFVIERVFMVNLRNRPT